MNGAIGRDGIFEPEGQQLSCGAACAVHVHKRRVLNLVPCGWCSVCVVEGRQLIDGVVFAFSRWCLCLCVLLFLCALLFLCVLFFVYCCLCELLLVCVLFLLVSRFWVANTVGDGTHARATVLPLL